MYSRLQSHRSVNRSNVGFVGLTSYDSSSRQQWLQVISNKVDPEPCSEKIADNGAILRNRNNEILVLWLIRLIAQSHPEIVQHFTRNTFDAYA